MDNCALGGVASAGIGSRPGSPCQTCAHNLRRCREAGKSLITHGEPVTVALGFKNLPVEVQVGPVVRPSRAPLAH